MGRRYFLTGCTGFIGREIVRKLLSKPDTEFICCLTRGGKSNLIDDPRLVYWIGDIGWCDFPDISFTDVIHGANEANDLEQPDKHEHYFTIVEGTRRVLEWVNQKQIQNCLILSSGAIVRNTVYGRAKNLCEKLARGCKIARIFSVIGPEMPLNSQFAAGIFVRKALAGKIEYYGGKSTRTYLDVSDCADWVIRILHAGSVMYPYDVAGSEQISIEELAIAIGRIFDVPVIQTKEGDRIDTYSPNLVAARSLGLTQTITLEQSLDKIHENLLSL